MIIKITCDYCKKQFLYEKSYKNNHIRKFCDSCIRLRKEAYPRNRKKDGVDMRNVFQWDEVSILV